MRLKDERYEEIKKEVAYMFEDYDVTDIAIDVFEIAEKMNIKIVYASEIIAKSKGKITEYSLYRFPPSYLHYNESEQRFYVYIDDVGTGINRQRFSMAHEIMHIRLGHQEQNAKNEAEANFGAQYMLSPTSLVLLDVGNLLFQEENFIRCVFEVSEPVAITSARYNYNRIHYFDLKPRDYEEIINSQLGNSFKKIISQNRVESEK